MHPVYCKICDKWFRLCLSEEHHKGKEHRTNHRTLTLLSEKTGETIDELAVKRYGYQMVSEACRRQGPAEPEAGPGGA